MNPTALAAQITALLAQLAPGAQITLTISGTVGPAPPAAPAPAASGTTDLGRSPFGGS